jgi:hypothetical protein
LYKNEGSKHKQGVFSMEIKVHISRQLVGGYVNYEASCAGSKEALQLTSDLLGGLTGQAAVPTGVILGAGAQLASAAPTETPPEPQVEKQKPTTAKDAINQALEAARKDKDAKKVEKEAAEAKEKETTSASEQVGAGSSEADVEEGDAVDYEAVKKAVLTLNKQKGREVALQLLGEFGVTTAPALKSEQYASVVSKANAILAA